MSKFLYTGDFDERYHLAVEQLEVCSELIKSASANKARMAIILLDNLADNLMLRYCNYKFSEDDFLSLYLKPNYTKQEVRDAKENIHGKVKILRKNAKSILTKKDEIVISICHTYRNSAQHNDEHNPQITNAMARVLFGVVSNLFVKIQHSGNAVYYVGQTPKWIQRYTTNTKIVYKEFALEIVSKLQKGISLTLPALKKILVSDIGLRVKKINEDVSELPLKNAKDLSHMLKMFEYQRSKEYKELEANAFDAKYRIESNTITYHDGFLKSKKQHQDKVLRDAFRPNVTFQTFQEIKGRHLTMLKEKDLLSTLKSYEKFSRPLEKNQPPCGKTTGYDWNHVIIYHMAS
jgi:hypothetical protein